jgi:hypothetical protein
LRTGALLRLRGISILAGDGREAAEESIDDGPCMKQVFERAERGRGRCRECLCGCGQIGPIGRNQRFTAIGQNEKEKQSTFALRCCENFKRFAFERMARTDHPHCFREVLMTGSVS